MMASERQRNRTIALLCLITLAGAALRLWQLGAQSLWLDEVFTARVAPESVAAILRAIRSDLDTPPLHPLLVHLFIVVFGGSDFVLRLPSALASIAAIPLMYALARRVLGEPAALVAAFVMACSPFAVYYAQEARMYGLMLTTTLLTLYTMLRALESRLSTYPATWQGRARRLLPWLGFAAAAAAGLYTHFFGFFVLGVAALYVAVHIVADLRAARRDAARRAGLSLMLALLVVALLYAPWLPVLRHFVGENFAANPYGQSWKANLGLPTMAKMLALMLGGYWAHPAAYAGMAILCVGGWLSLAHRRRLMAVLVVLATALPFAVIAVLNPGHFVTERYFIFMLPALILCVTEGLAVSGTLAMRLLRRASNPQAAARATVLAAAVLVPVLSAPALERYFTEPPKPAWRPLSRYVAGAVPPGDLIVVATFPHWDKEPLQHYLRGGTRRIVYAAEEPNLRRLLTDEQGHVWWIVYAGSERRLGRLMSSDVGQSFTITPFDYLAVVRRSGDRSDGVADGRVILRALRPRIPPTYQGEVNRVINGLSALNGDMGQPLAPPVPTTIP